MTLTADQVYDLVKHDEPQFPIPAPYTTVDVGLLDVGSGAFAGLRTESERDPEPLEHLPGQHPHNPAPHFVGSRWVSVTIDATWHQTITSTPAPAVPLAPVLLRFAVSAAPTAWSVTAAGRTRVAPAGQTVLLVDVWDATVVNWTITAGALSAHDGLRLQRPVGPPPAGLGAFTIPVLPLSVVYAPPADAHGQSTAAYSTGHTVGTSVDIGFSNSSSSSVPVQAVGFVGQVQGFAGALRAEAVGLSAAGATAAATAYTTIADQLGQVTATHQIDVTDGFEQTMTVSQSTTETTGTTAAGGGPGEGDVLHFYKDVRMVWSYVDGRLRLCPIDAVEVITTARGLRADAHGLAPADVAALLALDPFGTDAAAAVLPADRFTLLERLEYGHGATLVRSITTTRDTKQQVTHRQITTDTTRWDAGPFLTALGVGGSTSTSMTLTNATGDEVSDSVTVTLTLVSGPDDYTVVDVYIDALFGTFALQPVPPAPTAMLRGAGLTPGRAVVLEVAGRTIRTVVAPDGTYEFRAPGIPDGDAVVRLG